MEDKKQEIFIYNIRYALSGKIERTKADVFIGDSGKVARIDGVFLRFEYGKDFALTGPEAVKLCEEKRIKKLQSLDRSIKKISALDFEKMATAAAWKSLEDWGEG